MKKSALSILLTSSVVLFTACGGDDGNNNSDSSTASNVDINNIQNPVVGTPTAYKFSDDTPPNAADSVVMTYKMKGVNGTETQATALLFTPKTAPPAGGWPIVAWAHGTTGIADACAPSRHPLTIPATFGPGNPTIKNMIDSFLKEGYVVVAPDYEGLGEPSGKEIHPYLNVKSAAYSITDAVVATKNWLGNKASNKWAVLGHSQGGHAALSAAQYATRTNMDYKGAVAVAPASNLRLMDSLIQLELDSYPDILVTENGEINPDAQKKAVGLATVDSFIALVSASIRSTHPTESVYSKIFRSPIDKVAEKAESECLSGIQFAFYEAILPYALGNNMSLKGYTTRNSSFMDDPIIKQFIDKDSQPLQALVKKPVIIYQGGADPLVLPQATDALVTQARALTTKIDYRTDPAWDHITVYIVNVENGKLLSDIKTMLSN